MLKQGRLSKSDTDKLLAHLISLLPYLFGDHWPSAGMLADSTPNREEPDLIGESLFRRQQGCDETEL